MGNQISDIAGSFCSVVSGDAPAQRRGEYCTAGGGQAHSRRRVHAEEASAAQLVSTFGSPMHAASMLGTAADIASLTAAGHGHGGTDKNGRTPCHLAALSGNLKNLKVLVDMGADLEAEDADGKTPLQSAVQCNRHQVVQWIKWRIWSEQDKFREGQAELRFMLPSVPNDRMPMQFPDLYSSGSSAYEHAAPEFGSSPGTPRSQIFNARGTAFSIPVSPSGPRARRANAARSENDSFSEPIDDRQPEFAWKEAQIDGEARRLAGILVLIFPDLELRDDELKSILRQSNDDMVQAIVLAQDRYGTQF